MTVARPERYRSYARTAAWWTIPAIVCLAVHWRGFEAWFRADDFAWLSLFGHIHGFHDLLSALFRPEAQGTIRPWSERAFFIVGYALFGLNALPYRIVIFATQFVALALVQAIGFRMSGSRAAGFLAAILWTLNSSSVEPLAWACVYNEVMCAAFLLLALGMLFRHLETGERRFRTFEWLVFLLGFGALELNIVYPALRAIALLAWAKPRSVVSRRELTGSTAAMFAVSLLYFILHSWAAPPSKTGIYAMHFGPSILRTLGVYWTWSVGPVYLATAAHIRRWMAVAAIALLSLALFAFFIRKVRAGCRFAIFCAAWYLITIAPLIPLRDHVTEYYPYIPVIGVAWLGGWGLAEAWNRGGAVRSFAAALALLYAALVLPRTLNASTWNYRLAEVSHDLVAGVARAHELHPSETLLLDGVDDDQFFNAVSDKAFALIGADGVYLTPGTEKRVTQHPEWDRVENYILAPSVAATAVERGQAEVYDVRGAVLRNITSRYAQTLNGDELPLRVSASEPLTSYLLGPEWYALDTDHRWMGRSASLRMGAPPKAGEELYLTGYCAPGLGDAQVTVTVNGIPLKPAAVPPGAFELSFALPDQVTGQHEMHVSVELSKTFRPPGETRDLGLSFGVFEVK